MTDEPKIAYLFSRHPVASQTFCDTEMLAIERHGARLEVHSIHPPPTSFRHTHHRKLRASVHYAPPGPVLKALAEGARADGSWPTDLLADHTNRFGEASKPEVRMRNAVYLAGAMRRHGVRHLHVHFANRAAHTALYIHQRSGIPFSFTAHAQDFMVELAPDLLAELVSAAAFVVAVSDHTRALLAERFPAHADKIHRVHNGIDLARFPASAPPRNRVPVLLSVGRLVPFKGFLHLIEACALLRDRGLVFRCDLVGEGPQRPAIEAAISNRNLNTIVRLIGPATQEEIASRMAGCDLFVLPCDIEADGSMDVLPTVITEAMACGRPVVSTPTAGVPELVVDGETGVLVPRADPGALASALFRLLADHELRGEFGAAGRTRVERLFRVEATSSQLLSLFRGALASAPVTEPAPAPPPEEVPTALVLLTRWPDPEFPAAEPALNTLIESGPGTLLLALGCPMQPSDPGLAARIAFLPDAMVLESAWREQESDAHVLEALRGDLPEALETGQFLIAAREAMGIRARYPQVLHVHAVGSRALLGAWMLHRAYGVSYSVHLPATSSLSPKLLAPLIAAAKGGWCADAALAGELGLQNPSPLAPPRQGALRRLLGSGPSATAEPWIVQLREWL